MIHQQRVLAAASLCQSSFGLYDDLVSVYSAKKVGNIDLVSIRLINHYGRSSNKQTHHLSSLFLSTVRIRHVHGGTLLCNFAPFMPLRGEPDEPFRFWTNASTTQPSRITSFSPPGPFPLPRTIRITRD